MKILNLSVDDLFFQAKFQPHVTKQGQLEDYLTLDLGAPISGDISNKVIFNGKNGWKIANDDRFSRSTFRVKKDLLLPTIWDDTVKSNQSRNLLFTGVFGADPDVLLAKTHILDPHHGGNESIEIIAGGYKTLESGEQYANLILSVATNLVYEIDGVYFSTDSGKAVNFTGGSKLSIKV